MIETSRRPKHLQAALASREQRHRRAVLVAIAALLVLSISPIFGHHIGSGTDALFGGRDHLGALCLIALHHLLEPVHRGFHLLLLAGVGYALWNRARAWASLRRVLSPLAAAPPRPGDPFHRAASDAGIEPSRVQVVGGLPTPAFTAGWLRPRVFVARELGAHLTLAELTAVLAHEASHVARRDPLRLSLLRFLTHTLFWIPALRSLADDVADEAELRADDRAAGDEPLVLAAAILNLAGWSHPRPALPATAAFDERGLVERRVRRLAGEPTPPPTRLTRRSLLGALAALTLVWVAGTAVAHPLPAGAGSHADHCEHPGTAPVVHLFCGRTPLSLSVAACPHARGN
ncbi:MAG: M56 family metallopeptidase [Longimicrobiaceae bacterium]